MKRLNLVVDYSLLLVLSILLYLSLTSPFFQIGGDIKISFLGVIHLGLHTQTILSTLNILKQQEQETLYLFLTLSIVVLPIICLFLSSLILIKKIPLRIKKIFYFLTKILLQLTTIPSFLLSLFILAISLSKMEGVEIHLQSGFVYFLSFFVLFIILLTIINFQNTLKN